MITAETASTCLRWLRLIFTSGIRDVASSSEGLNVSLSLSLPSNI